MSHYDLIVAGTGGVGSAAMFHAAKRGLRVLGIDPYPPAHDRGSSHGQTRLIRESYFEHPNYVPLIQRAMGLWRNLMDLQEGAHLFHRTGVLYFAREEDPLIQGVLRSAEEYQLPLVRLIPSDAEAIFPGFVLEEDKVAVLEENGGYLLVEQCVQAHLSLAGMEGAEHRYGERVTAWKAGSGGVEVQTDRGHYQAERLIITAGPWAGELLRDLGLSLRILRKHMHWFDAPDQVYGESHGFPCVIGEYEQGYLYSFPAMEPYGLKAAEHSGGTEVAGSLKGDDRSVEAEDSKRVEGYLRRHLPGVEGRRTRHEVCYYTMSETENFVVDQYPETPQVVFAAGLSGHGFKFASALGEALVQMAVDGRSELNLDFLSLAALKRV